MCVCCCCWSNFPLLRSRKDLYTDPPDPQREIERARESIWDDVRDLMGYGVNSVPWMSSML
jgi:hypothetical protein